MAAHEEMLVYINKANTTEDKEEIATLPWAPEEELLVLRQLQGQTAASIGLPTNMGNIVLWAVASIAYGLVHNSLGAPGAKVCLGTEKLLV